MCTCCSCCACCVCRAAGLARVTLGGTVPGSSRQRGASWRVGAGKEVRFGCMDWHRIQPPPAPSCAVRLPHHGREGCHSRHPGWMLQRLRAPIAGQPSNPLPPKGGCIVAQRLPNNATCLCTAHISAQIWLHWHHMLECGGGVRLQCDCLSVVCEACVAFNDWPGVAWW